MLGFDISFAAIRGDYSPLVSFGCPIHTTNAQHSSQAFDIWNNGISFRCGNRIRSLFDTRLFRSLRDTLTYLFTVRKREITFWPPRNTLILVSLRYFGSRFHTQRTSKIGLLAAFWPPKRMFFTPRSVGASKSGIFRLKTTFRAEIKIT